MREKATTAALQLVLATSCLELFEAEFCPIRWNCVYFEQKLNALDSRREHATMATSLLYMRTIH
jgi:hypothetical protein